MGVVWWGFSTKKFTTGWGIKLERTMVQNGTETVCPYGGLIGLDLGLFEIFELFRVPKTRKKKWEVRERRRRRRRERIESTLEGNTTSIFKRACRNSSLVFFVK